MSKNNVIWANIKGFSIKIFGFLPSCGWESKKTDQQFLKRSTSHESHVACRPTGPKCCFGLSEREPRFFWGKQKRPRAVVGSGTQKMPPLASKYVLCVNWRSTMQMLQETMFLGVGHFGCSLALRHYISLYFCGERSLKGFFVG